MAGIRLIRQQRVGVFPVRLHVTTDDLEIDRCGHAEIEDLADHVGRQEGERGAWEHARQPLAHGSDVVGRRRWFGLRLMRMSASSTPIVPELL